MNKRLWIFIIFFIGINLIFIPLLSLYGLRVCPVLSIPGFGFGCYYSAIYIGTMSILNLAMILLITVKTKISSRFPIWLKENRFISFLGIYLLATGLALVVLQYMLELNHLTSKSRAPEILGLASLLLAILQSYGLNWAFFDLPDTDVIKKSNSFKKLWGFHVARTILPILVMSLVIVHFLITQSQSFNDGRIAPIVSHDTLIDQTSYVVYFLLIWMLVTFTFHFLSERDQVGKVQYHLNQLNYLDFKFRSPEHQTWGLWSAIISQLNSFSKVLGERTRLLKTFSRFVTAGVAEQALHNELKETKGSMRELTVLMSDIRNFTSMSEKLTPNQVVQLLNEYFSAMLDVISGSSVSVDKFIGDGILAYVDPEEGEAPNAKAENQLGVGTALAMIEKLVQLNKKFELLNLPEIKIGIGIYRGPLVIGLIGSEAKLQHTIVGDTVNRTARLESLCKDLGVSIVISGHVWHSLEPKEKSLFKSFGRQQVKGIEGAIEVFGGPILDSIPIHF